MCVLKDATKRPPAFPPFTPVAEPAIKREKVSKIQLPTPQKFKKGDRISTIYVHATDSEDDSTDLAEDRLAPGMKPDSRSYKRYADPYKQFVVHDAMERVKLLNIMKGNLGDNDGQVTTAFKQAEEAYRSSFADSKSLPPKLTLNNRAKAIVSLQRHRIVRELLLTLLHLQIRQSTYSVQSHLVDTVRDRMKALYKVSDYTQAELRSFAESMLSDMRWLRESDDEDVSGICLLPQVLR